SPYLAEAQSRALEAAARSRGLQLHVLKASTEQDFDIAFAGVARLGASGLVISSDSFFFSQSAQLARLAIRHAVPTIFGFREFVAAGGLMSYGGSLTESFRWVGVYTGRVLKGEKLANLPVQQSQRLSCSSISRPPRRSVSNCRRHCSRAPMILSNDKDFRCGARVRLWHEAAVRKCPRLRRLWGLSGHRSAPSIYE